MDVPTLLGTAFALAMDTVAVAVAAGISLPAVTRRHIFRLAWHFGLFQFLMPVLGWGAGMTVRPLIERFDHWVAFGLLVFVGGNMIRESLSGRATSSRAGDPSRGAHLVILSIATSIDALAVGLSFAVLNMQIWVPALVIGAVTALCTAAGLHAGKRIRKASLISACADVLGGVVLIGIGLKILFAHGVGFGGGS